MLNDLRACLKGDARYEANKISYDRSCELRNFVDSLARKVQMQTIHYAGIFEKDMVPTSLKLESGLGFRETAETTNDLLLTLEELDDPSDAWDSMNIFWIPEKLDNVSKKTNAIALPGTDLPKWQALVKV